NQKHVFSVFNNKNNNNNNINNTPETTDPIFRYASSSNSTLPPSINNDQGSIRSNNYPPLHQFNNNNPTSQLFHDSSPPTPLSNNSAYNINRESKSNTFTSLTRP